MTDYTKPVYQVDGREFKSVAGLCNYLLRKHAKAHASAVSGVRSDRTLLVFCTGSIGRIEVACYQVSAPEVGKPMTLTEVAR